MRPIRWAHPVGAVLAFLAAQACQSPSGDLDARNDRGATGDAGDGTPAAGASSRGQIQARTWRLNRVHYANSIRQIGLNPEPAVASFPDDTVGAPFVSSNILNVQQVLAEKYATAAELLGAQAQAQGDSFFKRFANCSSNDATCVETFVATLGRTLYRRPVSQDQLARLKAIFAGGAELSGIAGGANYVVQAMLQSPLFLYRTELGPSNVAPGSSTVTTLTPYEVASLLAFMLTDAPPDPELSRAADADALKSDAQLQAQFARLSKLPAAAEKVTSFMEALFGVNGINEVPKDEKLFPDAKLIQANLQLSFRSDVRFVLDSGDSSWASALRMNSYSVNGVTAGVFGMDKITGSSFVRREAPPAERRGLLTHPAVMAAFSHAAESAPIPRAKMVLARLLCRPPSPPPANSESMLMADKLPTTATRRQQFDALIARPACAGCHTSLNGIGFSLDNYDALGRFRTADQKGPLDVKGEVFSLQGDGTKEVYQGGVQLADRLADSKVAKECVSLQSYRYFLGLPSVDTTFDSNTRAAFVERGAKLDQLAALIVSSPNFKERVK
jgi:hypothetical protein